MNYHLDYGLRYNAETKNKGLYSWAINEVKEDGSVIDRDQIPWVWTLYFSALSCEVRSRIEIERNRSLENGTDDLPRVEADQFIRMTLRPEGRWGGVKFSMFGTKRVIQDFTLEVRAAKESEETEGCEAWGIISYTSEIDFIDETQEDCIGFYFCVKSDVFTSCVDLINRNAVDEISFSVGGVDGFYSNWSPSISTDSVKVLLRDDEHKLDLPPDIQRDPPRLGQVRKARLLFRRRLELNKTSALPAENNEEADDEEADPMPLVSVRQSTLEMSLILWPILASLKRAAWVAVSLLATIAAIALQKY